jgi:copper(I)-binding protein
LTIGGSDPVCCAVKERNDMLFKMLFALTCLLLADAAMAQTGQIEIKDAWARATPGRAENGAAYLTIISPAPDRLTGASSPVAKKVELHTMSMEVAS